MATFQDYKNTLIKEAEAPSVCRELDNSIPLDRYLQAAKLLMRQANSYKNEGDIEHYYVYTVRFINLFVNVIKKHNSANRTAYRKDIYIMNKVSIQHLNEYNFLNKQCDESFRYCEHDAKNDLMKIYNQQHKNNIGMVIPPPTNNQPIHYPNVSRENSNGMAPFSYLKPLPPQSPQPSITYQGNNNTSLNRNVPNNYQQSPPYVVSPPVVLHDHSPSYQAYEAPSPSAPLQEDYYTNHQPTIVSPLNSPILRPIFMNQRMIDEFLSYGYDSLEHGIEFCATLCGKLRAGRFVTNFINSIYILDLNVLIY
jgi:hypothetical protein